ncbi:hypothetical protein KJ742_03665 [Patescibacteria group bacterium]|nr:hypothetical protein [Patescibacteria group bacterium]MBU1683019.1 hypothetical protein [Patescibacteria group bacterium]MBU1935247.1 hypothetical protein [Patescibacteria group bacterium]
MLYASRIFRDISGDKMAKDITNYNELLTQLLDNQNEQIELLCKIKNWLVFFGILTIIALILSACEALLS